MPWPTAADANAALPPKLDRVGALHDELDHPGEAAEQDQVDAQDDEGPPAAHPAAQLLHADRADATARPHERPMRPDLDVGARLAAGAPARSTAAVSTGSMSTVASRVGSVTSLTRHPLRCRRLGLLAGDLEEELLEVARRPGEADDRQSRGDRRRRADGRPRRRRRGSRARSCRRAGSSAVATSGSAANAAARGLEGLALGEHPDAQDRPEPEPSLDVGDRPWARTRPRSTMATLVHSSSSSGRMWLLMRIVLPSDRSSRRSSRSSTRARGSRPDAGSSRSRTCGSWTRACARHSRCCMPRERVWTYSSRLSAEVDELEQVADHPASRGRPRP